MAEPPIDVYTAGTVAGSVEPSPAQRRADARRAKGWKHTADFLNQVANTTIGVGFLTPVATWAFGVNSNPLSAGQNAPIIAVLWLISGVVIHTTAGTIVRSFDL